MGLVQIWTDGSANNHTGNKGGYGIVLVNGSVKHYCGGCYINTTSARMELMGIVKGLEKCTPGDQVVVYCDNQYAVNSLAKKWIFRWEKQGWDGRKNGDLLKQLLEQYRRLEGKVKLKWVRGHNGNEYNEIADALASRGASRSVMIKDRKRGKIEDKIETNPKWMINDKGKIVPRC